ncbi:AbrB/MazE/SpoVT family DNA-binding domain-containing protein [Actinoplanes sp. NPDC048967]|uniref:AbrB/MazE/SpoVT family DNA-binding domain-containing protein n=1 Tax=Actinoplanes sp. NPDC048967 TaxID=3155269 RepID=UPI0033FBCFF8
MPLAKLSEKRAGSAGYGVSTLDASGRIADRTIMRALAWAAGQRLDIRESKGLTVVAADDNGLFRVTKRGYVHLPAAVRHWCRLGPGDRVLLAAYPAADLLVAHSPAVLDTLVDAIHAQVLGGEQS